MTDNVVRLKEPNFIIICRDNIGRLHALMMNLGNTSWLCEHKTRADADAAIEALKRADEAERDEDGIQRFWVYDVVEVTI
jgi:hypothetical protein